MGSQQSLEKSSQVATMKDHYDFSEGKRGAVIPMGPGKTRITIRLDADIVAWFKEQVHEAGGGNYQSLINEALRHHIEREAGDLEVALRKVIREEMGALLGSSEKRKAS